MQPPKPLFTPNELITWQRGRDDAQSKMRKSKRLKQYYCKSGGKASRKASGGGLPSH